MARLRWSGGPRPWWAHDGGVICAPTVSSAGDRCPDPSITLVAAALVVALWTPVGAHNDGTLAHLWNHIKVMGDAGTINTSTNPVQWTKLKGVPSSIADGVDNIGVPAFGLKQVYGAYFVDSSVIQRRVESSCVKGQAIRSISSTGAISCSTGPQGYTLRIANTGQICDVSCTEGSLTLSPGTWAIFGKITVHQTDGSEDHLFSSCQLNAGGLVDESEGDAQIDNITETVTMNMQLMVKLTNLVNTSISCGDGGAGSAYGSNLSIIGNRLAD